MTEIQIISELEGIRTKIFSIRTMQVMIDRDLAELYGVETKRINEQVKRNIQRFPERYCFQLSLKEKAELVAKCDRFASLKHSSSLPYAFTESGVAILSIMLKSETAIKVSIQIIDAFIEMRRFLRENSEVLIRLDNVEQKHIILQHETNKKFDQVFNALQSQDLKPKQGIFYDGQVFDAYVFIADLIRTAKSSIVLIDNYVDETVLNLFTKRIKGVSLTIHTKDISKQLLLDKKKHDQQYDPVTIKQFKNAHDRFLIIDGVEVYHIGASLKDLGLKWFAFSKMALSASDILTRLI
jgi:hypothetical protein